MGAAISFSTGPQAHICREIEAFRPARRPKQAHSCPIIARYRPSRGGFDSPAAARLKTAMLFVSDGCVISGRAGRWIFRRALSSMIFSFPLAVRAESIDHTASSREFIDDEPKPPGQVTLRPGRLCFSITEILLSLFPAMISRRRALATRRIAGVLERLC